MEIDILGIGLMDKDQEKASFGGQMEINILDNGKMIKEMVKVKKYGLMEIDMKGIGLMIRNKAWDIFSGEMEINIMVNGKIIIL